MSRFGEFGGARLGFRLSFSGGLLDVFLGFSLLGFDDFILLPSAILIICGSILIAIPRFRVVGSFLVLMFSAMWWLSLVSNFSAETLLISIIQATSSSVGVMSLINFFLGIIGGIFGLLNK